MDSTSTVTSAASSVRPGQPIQAPRCRRSSGSRAVTRPPGLRFQVVVPQLRLGEAYEQGKGVARDMAIAAKWYRKAAEAGDHAACLARGGVGEGGDVVDLGGIIVCKHRPTLCGVAPSWFHCNPARPAA